MNAQGNQIHIDGKTIVEGTSIYHGSIGRVLWFQGVSEGYVQLRSVGGPFEIKLSMFEQYVEDETFLLESTRPECFPE